MDPMAYDPMTNSGEIPCRTAGTATSSEMADSVVNAPRNPVVIPNCSNAGIFPIPRLTKNPKANEPTKLTTRIGYGHQ